MAVIVRRRQTRKQPQTPRILLDRGVFSFRAPNNSLRGLKMAKMTVDQMIARLTPDRQKAVLDKADKITHARAKARQQEQAIAKEAAQHLKVQAA